MTARIHLKNMAFYGYHGHHRGESEQGQRFLVDLVLTLDIAAASSSDRLADTIDYGKAYDVVRGIVEKDRVKLLETLCDRIMDAILRELERVDKVEVTVKKPSAPIPGVLDYVAVEASRVRVPRPGK